MPFQDIICDVRQGSILGPLLLVLYINDLKNASNALDPIIFVNDTNISTSDRNIHTIFTKANLELQKIDKWFKANKLSPNTKKSVLFL